MSNDVSFDMARLFADAIESSNQKKPAEAPLVIVIQGTVDPNDAYRALSYQWNFLQIAKTHSVALHVLDSRLQIGDVVTRWKDRQIDCIIIHAHGVERKGDKIIFGLGEDGLYSLQDVKENDYGHLPQDVPIVIMSCFAAKQIAKRIAECAKRSVIAVENAYSENHCVHKTAEGWGVTSFNQADHRFIKMFKPDGMESRYRVKRGNDDYWRGMIDYIRERAVNEDPIAQYKLGVLSFDGEIPVPEKQTPADAAAEWFKKAADQGHKESQCCLANLYWMREISPPDGQTRTEAAVMWFKRAMDQGDGNSAYALGSLYENGEIIPPAGQTAIDVAAAYYQRAADQGNREAHLFLARFYLEKLIPPIAGKTAHESFSLSLNASADQEYHEAQYVLGQCYENGILEPPVGQTAIETAIEWYKKASEQNHRGSALALKRLEDSAEKSVPNAKKACVAYSEIT